MMEKGFVTYEDDSTMVDIVGRFINDQSHILDSDDAFSLMDLGYHVEMVDRWKQLLPRVMPFFAVKCEPDPILLRMMAQMNFGFDCASKKEIELVIGLGVHPSRIIYAHPRKQPSHLRYASAVGVKMTVFDDKDELYKIKKNAPDMKLLLRLSTKIFAEDARAAMLNLFGCSQSKSKELLMLANELGMNICGVSYHMGGSPRTADLYGQALRQAKEVFQEGLDLGFNMDIIDVGGNFPSNTSSSVYFCTFDEVAKVIDKVIKEELDEKVKLIAEPGALFALPSSVLVANILGTRKQECEVIAPVDDQPVMEYFINDGMFSSFRYYNEIGVTPMAKPVGRRNPDGPSDRYRSRIWGQTCAGDMVVNECLLPEMKTGDWLCFTDMGGYCHILHSPGFNGFFPPPVYRFIRESSKNRLNELIADKPFSFVK